jgi:MoaA/NifB/PqqE/SkfB family radical SAM enzyme
VLNLTEKEKCGDHLVGIKMKYYELEPEENIFDTLLVDITHRCNMECANCYIPNRNIPDMDKNKLYEFLSRLPKRTDIRLIGAEATVRDDLFEIIKCVRKFGHHPALLTNGLRLASDKYVVGLKENGIKSLGLSMNGADNDDWYQLLDNGPFAKSKGKALKNCFKNKIIVHTNTIIVDQVNEDVVKRQIDLLVNTAQEFGRTFKKTNPVIARFKSVGQIGRYINSKKLSLENLIDIFLKSYPDAGISKEEILEKNKIQGHTECNSVLFYINTSAGSLGIKLTDWSVDDDGVPDSGSTRRGRVTQDFKCAPFFEHVKLNEFGY